MDYTVSTVVKQDWTLAQICACMLSKNSCDPLVRSSFSAYAGTPHVGLDYSTAVSLFRAKTAGEKAKGLHPVANIGLAASMAPIAVTPQAMSQTTNGVETVMPYNRGYFAPVETKLETVKAFISDMISYVYTPNTSIPTSMVVPSNFASADPSIGLPVVHDVLKVSAEFKARDAIANSQLIFSEVSTDMAKWAATVSRAAAISQDLVSQGYTSALASRQVTIAGRVLTPPGMYVPNAKGCGDANVAYRVLERHRATRGVDKKWISPLGSGYYIGSMPKAMEAVWWRVVDILTVYERLEKPSYILLNSGVGSLVARSLAANGCLVICVSENSADYTTLEKFNALLKAQKGGGVFFVPGVVFSRLGMKSALFVDVGLQATPNALVGKDATSAKYATCFSSLLIRRCPAMAWLGVSEEVLKYAKAQGIGVCLSVHAHSGQAVFVTRPAPSFSTAACYNLNRHLARMVTANIFKSHFPISRCRFYETDKAKFGYDGRAINRIIIALNPERRKVVDLGSQLQDLTLEDGPMDGRIDADLMDFVPPAIAPAVVVGVPAAFEAPVVVSVDLDALLADVTAAMAPVTTTTTTTSTHMTGTATVTTTATAATGLVDDIPDNWDDV